jgi:alpha-tubulin suppressor-like RCC1 family protein
MKTVVHGSPIKTIGLAILFVTTMSSCRDTSAPQGPTGAKYVLTFSPSAPLAGDIVTASAQLIDEAGTSVRLAGRQVKWSTTAGVLSPASSVTNDDGSAVTHLVLSNVAGASYQISVADDRGMSGYSVPFTSLTGPPARYLVTTPSSSLQIGSTITVQAQVTDAKGNPVAGAGRVVTWSTLGGNPSAAFAPPTSSTNASGVVSADLTVGTVANVTFAIVVVDNQSLVGSSASIRTTPGVATQYIVTVDSSEVNPPAGAPVMAHAQLSDVYGNAATDLGRIITWSFTGAGASLSENGATNVVLTTSGMVGTAYTISAHDGSGLNGTTAAITTQPQVSLSSIATGFDASSVCGTSAAGELWCWGDGGVGQLGNGATYSRYLATRGGTNVKLASVSVGSTFACGLTSAGAAYCWGNNLDGALGDGTLTSRSSPTAVASTVAFQILSAGGRHVCGVALNGDAYCWGANENGRLGAVIDGTVATAPVKVSGGLSFVAISAGQFHTCGIVNGGAAYCWGLNASGQLGDNSQAARTAPTPVYGAMSFTAISAGGAHTCGVVQSGAAYCWGDNTHGQLGITTHYQPRQQPWPVAGGFAFKAISAGALHTCALTPDGLAYCWGDGFMGQLGNGRQAAGQEPVVVAGGLRFTTIGASSALVTGPCDYYCYYYGSGPASNAHTCGLTTDGTAYCWGSNDSGQLGRGRSETSSLTPVKVAGQH